jgi:hypothetical protein
MDALTMIVMYALLRFVIPFVLLLLVGTWVQRRLSDSLRHA